MQRILQINIAGSVFPIEEDAYNMLKNYLTSLERQFTGEDGREIIGDIENRIAELFSIRMQNNVPAIDSVDVQKVINTLGTPNDLRDSAGNYGNTGGGSYGNRNSGSRPYGYGNQSGNRTFQRDRLLRDPFDKILGGVCSGVAKYFDIDTVIVRLIMVVLFLTFGIGFFTYIIAWVIIPAARTPEELYSMNRENPVTFHDISRNVGAELEELKQRAEAMSRELKDFFNKKK